jgi:very-short-patch-repair endonuclease
MPASLSRSTVSLLQARASLMRAEPSPEERTLWRHISAGQLGAVFRRQVPLPAARCIADFLARAAGLVIECWGTQCTPR